MEVNVFNGKVRLILTHLRPQSHAIPCNFSVRILVSLLLYLFLIGSPLPGEAVEVSGVLQPIQTAKGKLERRLKEFKRIRKSAKKDWHYGAYLDVGYLPNLSSPDADEWWRILHRSATLPWNSSTHP